MNLGNLATRVARAVFALPAAADAAPPKAHGAAHQGASLDVRDLATWQPTRGSADADLLPELGLLTARSRDLARNTDVAAGAFQTMVDNVVGTGLRLASTPDYRLLGKDKAWAEDWSNTVESHWRTYANSTTCDASGTMTLSGLSALAFRAALMSGDAVGLPLWLPRPGERWATRIQLIEADRLSNPNDAPDSATLRGGVEIDNFGAPIAYHIRRAHPGDWYVGWGSPAFAWERIPATTAWGRRRVLHALERERPGQTRGKPLLAPVLRRFKVLDRYETAELQAAVVNAMIAAFIQTPMEQESIVELFHGDQAAYLDARGKQAVQLEGGGIFPLFPGDTLAPFTPSRPASAFGPFTETVLRQIAAGINIPYELLMKDFSKTNYSSARAALIEAWRFFRGRREWLSQNWMTPIYELWLEEAVNAGIIEAPGYYEHRAAYARCRWIGPGRGWVDPVKEAQAAQIRMDAGLSTLEAECSEQGLDWEEVLEQQATENARRRELGLAIPGAPAITQDTAPAEQSPAEHPQEG